MAAGQAAPRQCGYDRWPVKVLVDKDRQQVDFNPFDTTIAKLVGIPIHEIPYPRDRRIEPEELRVYRLRARLVKIRHEQDSDLHLILADLDKPSIQMIVEIPAPECGEGSSHLGKRCPQFGLTMLWKSAALAFSILFTQPTVRPRTDSNCIRLSKSSESHRQTTVFSVNRKQKRPSPPTSLAFPNHNHC